MRLGVFGNSIEGAPFLRYFFQKTNKHWHYILCWLGTLIKNEKKTWGIGGFFPFLKIQLFFFKVGWFRKSETIRLLSRIVQNYSPSKFWRPNFGEQRFFVFLGQTESHLREWTLTAEWSMCQVVSSGLKNVFHLKVIQLRY